MKRNRAETTPSRNPSSPPTKTQKRNKDPNPKGMGRARASADEKARKGKGGGKTAAAIPAVDPTSSPAAAATEEEVVEMLGWEGEHYGWLWGVEEEILLGWFPFVDEHFFWSENREGSGIFWEEEEGEDYDIWQLQHINEIPNPTAK